MIKRCLLSGMRNAAAISIKVNLSILNFRINRFRSPAGLSLINQNWSVKPNGEVTLYNISYKAHKEIPSTRERLVQWVANKKLLFNEQAKE
jgi:hypothetical protein